MAAKAGANRLAVPPGAGRPAMPSRAACSTALPGAGRPVMPLRAARRTVLPRAGRPVIPVYIGGPYRLFRRTQVSFGPPVDLSDLGRRMDSETLSAATARIEAAVWGLKR